VPLTQVEIEDGVRALLAMATNRVPVSHWLQALDHAPTEVLAGVVAQLTPQFIRRPGYVQFEAEQILALRDSVRATIDARNSKVTVSAMGELRNQLVATMKALERTNTVLAIVGLLIAAAGVAATCAG
jgi:hypothetical protein